MRRLTLLAALLACSLAGSARADTTVIGSLNLPAGGAQQFLNVNTAAFQLTGGDANYVAASPVTGIITSWSYRQGSMLAGEQLRLRVLGDTGPNTLRALGTSAPAPPTPDATDVVRGPFASSLAIQAGELIALESVAGGDVPVLPGVPGAEEDFLDPPYPLADGSSTTYTPGGVNQTQLLVQATIDFTPPTPPTTPPTTPPAPPAVPPDTALAVLPPPVEGQNVDVAPVSGTVLVRIPPSKNFIALQAGQQVPLGAEVDVTQGRVRLVAATAPMSPVTKTSDFYGGRFTVSQPANTAGRVDLKLTGALGHCATIHNSLARSTKTKAKAKAPSKRYVWGDGHGTFRTVGQRGSAAVRGTNWQVEDRCDGSTLVVVKRGIVAVSDNVRHKTVLVKAGHRYLIRPR
jgi:hypothetical protein